VEPHLPVPKTKIGDKGLPTGFSLQPTARRIILPVDKTDGRSYPEHRTFAVFAVLATNYKPSTSPPPRKSWGGDRRAKEQGISAVPSLFRAVFAEARGRVSRRARKEFQHEE
jgi:hypothetical protein